MVAHGLAIKQQSFPQRFWAKGPLKYAIRGARTRKECILLFTPIAPSEPLPS